MTSPGPAFQECTGSCHENVPAPKAVLSDLQLTDGLTVLARIEIVAILVHYKPTNQLSQCMIWFLKTVRKLKVELTDKQWTNLPLTQQ